MAISLVSVISFGDDATHAYYISSSNVAYQTQMTSDWDDGTCLDLDLINGIVGLIGDISNYTVACGDATADIKCVGKSGSGVQLQTLWGTKHTATEETDNALCSSFHPAQASLFYKDFYGKQWVDNDTIVMNNGGCTFVYGITTEGKYYAFRTEEYATNNKCVNVYFALKNVTNAPYLNYTSSKSIFSGFTTLDFTTGALHDYVEMDVLDLGYTIDSEIPNATFKYYNGIWGENILTTYAPKTKCIYGSSNSTSIQDLSNTSHAECDTWDSDVYYEINAPSTQYSMIYFNDSRSNATYDNYSYMAVKFIYTGYWSSGKRLQAVLFQDDWFTLFDIQKYPALVMPNMSVTFYWKSTLPADSRIEYRAIENNLYNESNNTGWITNYDDLYNATESTTHEITLDGYYIVDNYYYEWRVISNRSGTYRVSQIFNFSVGTSFPTQQVPSKYDDDVLKPANVLDSALRRLTNTMNIDLSIGYNLFAMIILVLFVVATLILSHNMILSAGVFIVGATLLAFLGWMPYYIFIIIALIFAFALVKLFQGVFNG